MIDHRRVLPACAALLAFSACLLAGQGEHEWKGGKWVPVAPPQPGTSAGEMAMIRHCLEQGKHKDAVEAAERFLAKYPDDAGGEEAMVLAGQAEMARGMYYQAFEWFEKQLRQYPGGEYFERGLARQYEIAEAFLKGKKKVAAKVVRLDARSEGLEILARIAEHAPGTAIAERSMVRIGDDHFSRQEWADAAEAYDRYLDLFGKGPNAPYAMLQAARATHACYLGDEYEDTPLLEAQQRFRTFAEQYPAEAAKERVAAILKDIDDRLAQKAYASAQFYERVGRPRAAAFYYRQVRQGHPGTQWADRAAKAMARLERLEQSAPRVSPWRKLLPSRAQGPAGAETVPDAPASAPAGQEGGQER